MRIRWRFIRLYYLSKILFLFSRDIKFPTSVRDDEFKRFILLMLTKDPLARLFNLAQIKNHSWFKDFNWDGLISLTVEPPYFPQIKENYKKKIEDSIPFQEFTIELNKKKEKKKRIPDKEQKKFDKWFDDF